jgi:preprotein translocase subunit SecF
MLLRLIPPGTKIPFVRFRLAYFLFSGTLLILSAISYGTQGLNFGIDFRGGILIEVRAKDASGAPRKADIGKMRSKLSGLGLGEVTLQSITPPIGSGDKVASDVLIRIEQQTGGTASQDKAIAKIKNALGKDFDYRRQEYVGPKVGQELIRAGIIATVLALGSILIYVWFRFEWQFGVAAVVALAHDVLLTIGLFSELQLEFGLATVAAVLTIAGYSINDTVVVFDRVRENLRKYKKMPLPELMNLSINETLSRTTLTSLTTILSVLALLLIGGEVIQDFSIALIWGVVIGTYSSICLAVPLLLMINIKRGGRREAAGDEGKAAAGAVAERQ